MLCYMGLLLGDAEVCRQHAQLLRPLRSLQPCSVSCEWGLGMWGCGKKGDPSQNYRAEKWENVRVQGSVTREVQLQQSTQKKLNHALSAQKVHAKTLIHVPNHFCGKLTRELLHNEQIALLRRPRGILCVGLCMLLIKS